MSRQNKQKKVIATRVQVTSLHKKGVAATDFKRTSINSKTRSQYSLQRTQKLTSAKKGVCKIVTDKLLGRIRVSVNTSTKVNAE